MSILRVKYKVRQNRLFANKPKICSPIWRAIKGAKNIIAKDACYQIGDGSLVDVWNSPWVCQLIDHDLHAWNASLIAHIFEAQSAQAILPIPIPSRPRPDTLIWTPTPKGDFSIKLAYSISKDHITTIPGPNIKWMKLWKFKASEHIKMLLWIIGSNALPTYENLLRKMPIQNLGCFFCNHDIESTTHLFIGCIFTRSICFACCWGLKPEEHSISISVSLIKMIQEHPKAPDLLENHWSITLIMVLVLGEVWSTRNHIIFSSIPPNPATSIISFNRKLAEFKSLSTITLPPKNTPLNPSGGWHLPHRGWLKLNVDAATSPTSTTLVVVANNDNGVAVKLWAKNHQLCSALQAEASAILWAT